MIFTENGDKKDHMFGGVVVVIKGSKQPWDFPRP